MHYIARFREGDLNTNLEVNGVRYNIYTDAFGNARQMRMVDGKPVGDPVFDIALAETLKGFKGWTIEPTEDEPLAKIEAIEGYDPELDPSHPNYERPLSQAELMRIEMQYALEAQRGSYAGVSPRAMATNPPPAPEPDLVTENATLKATLLQREEYIARLESDVESLAEAFKRLSNGGVPGEEWPGTDREQVSAGQVTVNPSPLQESDPSTPETAAPTAADMGKDNRTPQQKRADTIAAKKAKGGAGENDKEEETKNAALGGITVAE